MACSSTASEVGIVVEVLAMEYAAFGPFRLFNAERRLVRDGAPVRIGSRALDILVALVERAGCVVTKQELLARVWPGITIEESSLRVHVAGLRKALGERREGVRYVANVPGRGYCFVGRLAPRPHDRAMPDAAAEVQPAARVLEEVLASSRFATLLQSTLHAALVQILEGAGDPASPSAWPFANGARLGRRADLRDRPSAAFAIRIGMEAAAPGRAPSHTDVQTSLNHERRIAWAPAALDT